MRRRLIACLIVLVLGALAAPRLELSYLPRIAFPEITVRLALPHEEDIERLSERFGEPIEAALRATGGVRSLGGQVTTTGLVVRAVLAPGLDVRSKSARLESELARLRPRLPPGSALAIEPGGISSGRQPLVLWLTGAWSRGEVRALRDALEDLETTSSVTPSVDERPTLVITPRDQRVHAAVEAALGRTPGGAALGRASRDGRELMVRTRAPLERHDLDRLRLPIAGTAVPFSALTTSRWTETEPEWRARLDGKDGRAMLVEPSFGTSPLGLRSSVERLLRQRALGDRVAILSETGLPLRQLVGRLLAALGAATLSTAGAAALLGAGSVLAWALVLPVAAAAVLATLLACSAPLDVSTVPGVALGLVTAPLVLAAREAARRPPHAGPRSVPALVASIALTGACLPITVVLAGGAIAPLLTIPARTTLITILAAMLAALLVPLGAPRDVKRRLTGRDPRSLAPALLRRAIRHAATIVLATVTAVGALAVFFGDALQPVSGRLTPPFADLVLSLRFAEGTTLERAGAQVATVEARLSADRSVARVWSRWSRSDAQIVVTVAPAERHRQALARRAHRLEIELAGSPFSLTARPLIDSADMPPVRFRSILRTESETDETASRYRLVLRSPRLEPLRRAERRIRERLAGLGVRDSYWLSGWGQPTTRLELRERPGAEPGEVERALAAVEQRLRYRPPRPWPGNDEQLVAIRPAHAPATPDDRPDRALLSGLLAGPGGAPVAPSSWLEITEATVPPRVQREAGRYVLPLDLRLPWNPSRRVRARFEIDRSLGRLRLPAGVELDKPALSRFDWPEERLRMLAVVLTLPVLLVALGACRLDSLVAALAAAAPSAAGLASVTPWLAAGPGGADELTLLALGAVLCLTLPVGWQLVGAANRVGPPEHGVGTLLRRYGAFAAGLLVAALGGALLLALPTAGLAAERLAWISPLRTAALAFGVTVLAQVTLQPALFAGIEGLRKQRTGAARRRPATWRDDASARPHDLPPGAELPTTGHSGIHELSVTNVTKVFRATPRGRLPFAGRTGRRRNVTERGDPRERADGFHALQQVGFTLGPGIVGLLGANGAGKTTLLRLLCGLIEPSRGRIRYRGVSIEPLNLPEYRRLIGFLPQGFDVYRQLSARAFLDYWALESDLDDRRARRREIDRVLELVGLEDVADRRVSDFSGGMRRRIGIARALLGDPAILIVDEPTTGLDVESRDRLRRSLLRVAERRIVVFSTHIASDIEAATSRILVLHRGRLLHDGSAASLLESARDQVVRAVVADERLRELTRAYRITTRVRTAGGVRTRIVLRPGQRPPAGAEPAAPNLEEAYLALMSRVEPEAGKVAGHYAELLDLGLET